MSELRIRNFGRRVQPTSAEGLHPSSVLFAELKGSQSKHDVAKPTGRCRRDGRGGGKNRYVPICNDWHRQKLIDMQCRSLRSVHRSSHSDGAGGARRCCTDTRIANEKICLKKMSVLRGR